MACDNDNKHTPAELHAFSETYAIDIGEKYAQRVHAAFQTLVEQEEKSEDDARLNAITLYQKGDLIGFCKFQFGTKAAGFLEAYLNHKSIHEALAMDLYMSELNQSSTSSVDTSDTATSSLGSTPSTRQGYWIPLSEVPESDASGFPCQALVLSLWDGERWCLLVLRSKETFFETLDQLAHELSPKNIVFFVMKDGQIESDDERSELDILQVQRVIFTTSVECFPSYMPVEGVIVTRKLEFARKVSDDGLELALTVDEEKSFALHEFESLKEGNLLVQRVSTCMFRLQIDDAKLYFDFRSMRSDASVGFKMKIEQRAEGTVTLAGGSLWLATLN